MQVKKKGQTCAEGLKINPLAQVCPLNINLDKLLKWWTVYYHMD